MNAPDGQEFWSGGEYTEILAPEKIVSSLFYADENGKIEPQDGDDVDVCDVVTFEEIGSGRTKLTLKRSHWDVGEDAGWNEIFDKLAAVVSETTMGK